MGWFNKTIIDGVGGVVEKLGGAIDSIITSDEERETLKNELIKIHLNDRSDARSMYEKDSQLQKIFAITFLIGYIAVSTFILYWLFGGSNMSTEISTFTTMIFTAMSMKVNTITDFLFGGSVDKKDKTRN